MYLDQSIKRRKLFESEHCDYFTKEIELGTNKNFYINNEYVTKEFDIDKFMVFILCYMIHYLACFF
ncbi:hypothetical protein RhiirC2_773857 [Rhizophagus irregularis]|uniref:Uncharacterized protein n=1 Tax=Rhizophagus irregularis TaxID=588596 RepID=A0A2N1NMW9_9GLOM|nr:hypothetical protein RhiirC2_773857 [Rhizophagus irregularis]